MWLNYMTHNKSLDKSLRRVDNGVRKALIFLPDAVNIYPPSVVSYNCIVGMIYYVMIYIGAL